MYWSILGIFDYGEYELLGVRDRVVVDVGAFVGDSSIYFALKGARKVIAIEPHPEAYVEMLENIKLNNLENIIVPINAYLICEQNKAHFGEAPMVTLNDVVSKYSIDGNAVLKMDCEGCEYDIILYDYAHVKLFDEIILEYHAMSAVSLVNY
jgi:tRNA G37 N-methylase Trm5